MLLITDHNKIAPLLKNVLTTISDLVLILNNQRNIIYSNRDPQTQIGVNINLPTRIGDLLKCVNRRRDPAGCGGSDACKLCGNYKAFTASRQGERVNETCRIRSREQVNRLEVDICSVFDITAVPLKQNNDLYSIFILKDVSQYRKQRIMEKVFLNDLIDMTAGISNLVDLTLTAPDKFNPEETINTISPQIEQFIEEIQTFRELSLAETNELIPEAAVLIDCSEIISRILKQFSYLGLTSNYQIIQNQKPNHQVKILTHPSLLKRVLSCMLKNAIEASDPESKIIISLKSIDDGVQFSIVNPTIMAKDAQLQVFQQSFSTKGPERGLGTYQMKLFSERYLNGRIWFESGTNNYPDSTAFFLEVKNLQSISPNR